MLEKVLQIGRKIIPAPLFRAGQPVYHYLLMLLGAMLYRFPGKKLFVIGITGTKGKTTVSEILNTILEDDGYKTALSSTLRFKVLYESKRNIRKMTMPGRFAMQRFLRDAIGAGCTHAILEVTSEGVKQYRHRFLFMNALIFTNLSPEHIESHGSYEKYRDAKLKIARELEKSTKKEKIIVVNKDDKESKRFLMVDVHNKSEYSLKEAEPYKLKQRGSVFTWRERKINAKISGLFNIYNMLAAATLAEELGIPPEKISDTLENFRGTPGRVEFIDEGQNFEVVVDYAHTPDSLTQFYNVFPPDKNICVLGNTGGGRDKWKRPEMARIAEKNCRHIILTNEDPYDEDPENIVRDMAEGVSNKKKLEIIMDRRKAIKRAFMKAKRGDNVLITGKGTDPYIMGPKGAREKWDDASVAREELRKLS